MQCVYCQAWNEEDERRCSRCGRRLRVAAPRPAPDGYPLTSAAAPALEALPGGQRQPSTPRPDAKLAELSPIPGGVPDLRGDLPPCRYRRRCDRAAAICDEPPLPRVELGPGHVVACRQPL